jgi:hypothetical protein
VRDPGQARQEPEPRRHTIGRKTSPLHRAITTHSTPGDDARPNNGRHADRQPQYTAAQRTASRRSRVLSIAFRLRIRRGGAGASRMQHTPLWERSKHLPHSASRHIAPELPSRVQALCLYRRKCRHITHPDRGSIEADEPPNLRISELVNVGGRPKTKQIVLVQKALAPTGQCRAALRSKRAHRDQYLHARRSGRTWRSLIRAGPRKTFRARRATRTPAARSVAESDASLPDPGFRARDLP